MTWVQWVREILYVWKIENNKIKNEPKIEKAAHLYLKCDDEAKSDSQELPVKECVVSIVVSESFISERGTQLLYNTLCIGCRVCVVKLPSVNQVPVF